MKTLPATASLLMTLLACGASLAQTTTPNPSLFTSSPTMGSSPPVGAVGIPLGATELAVPGIAPPPTGGVGNGCSATGAATSTGSTSFDGGGMAATGSIGCTQSGGGSTGSSMPPLGLTAGQTGRAGIPLGSTELGNPGLSPLPPLTTINIPTTVPTTIPTAAPTSTGPSSVLSSTPSTSPCAVSGSFGGRILPGQDSTTASGC